MSALRAFGYLALFSFCFPVNHPRVCQNFCHGSVHLTKGILSILSQCYQGDWLRRTYGSTLAVGKTNPVGFKGWENLVNIIPSAKSGVMNLSDNTSLRQLTIIDNNKFLYL